jgi:hypothetical protein
MTKRTAPARCLASLVGTILMGLAVIACDTSTTDYFSGKFACTRRKGDWGLFKQQPEGQS